MYHSITFGNKNTWDDWHLIPETQIVINPPTQKTNFIDIPGASGSLDMSEVLTGYPIFNDRTGSFTFIVTNKYASSQPYTNYKDIHKVLEDIMEHLHGRRMRMVLEDDPNYFYEGRFEVTEPGIEENFNKITINYTLDPYKWSVFNSVDTNWLWDTFSFVDGVIVSGLFRELPCNNSAYVTIPHRLMGKAPIQPLFVMEKNEPWDSQNDYWYVIVYYHNETYSSGNLKTESNYTFEDLVITGDEDVAVTAYCSRGGKFSINFRPGRL